MKKHNNWDGKKDASGDAINLILPSLNQISNGLIAEAMVQLKQAMGKIKDQKAALEAEANIKKTWVNLLDHPKIQDKNARLVAETDYNSDRNPKPLGL